MRSTWMVLALAVLASACGSGSQGYGGGGGVDGPGERGDGAGDRDGAGGDGGGGEGDGGGGGGDGGGGADGGGAGGGGGGGADGGGGGGADGGGGGGSPDAAIPTGGCISGGTGTHVVRFRWDGSTSGSTAYVDYVANTLPDSAGWHVSAANAGFGFTPTFVDPFLGEGGLDLSGSTFIDVELSTVGLSSIRNVTLGIYGRSFAVSTSGSFEWQTFDDIGATATNAVSNIPPYAWTTADATTAFSPGDDGVYLRIRPGPSSNSLVVAAVELCFDAS